MITDMNTVTQAASDAGQGWQLMQDLEFEFAMIAHVDAPADDEWDWAGDWTKDAVAAEDREDFVGE